ncbi:MULTISPECIES: helix-turn-helix transcriptional regulator [Erysipelotrichaceae]|uniref:Helix-turn-helix transcriptional regulator n=1 Tax=[Eubacterium] hominis TaxID=2764325 RepID=A0A7G9GNR1_9FIRM|nr:helix-turn-helix transcriptional regulator [Absiella sp. AM27-20]QNM12443.1 helix-turn-helix transcriptional regulator [[Eubacterium] hominis]RHU10689.1 XRE family transcriptional regulator [Absiella sp. AM27-20]
MGNSQAERVKCLRAILELSQEAFGNKLGVTKTAISRIEKAERSLTDQMAKAICREFNVNWAWLTEGIGDMFSDLPETLLDEVAEEYDLDDTDKLLVKRYMQLSHEKRAVIKEYLESVFVKEKGG